MNNEWQHIESADVVEDAASTSSTDVVDAEATPVFDNPLDEPDSPSSDDYGEVLQLTEYNDGMLATNNNSYGVVAEYRDIDVDTVDKQYQIQAKNFVGKITKFIIELGDVELTDQHKSYLRDVGKLQVANLADMLAVVEMNKSMIRNIARRVNATQAEDYMLIQTYNQLLNQHMKLCKELQQTYKNIPATLKKMKADVMLDAAQQVQAEEQQVDETKVVTENFGETQFNSGKHLLRKLREEVERKSREQSHTEQNQETQFIS